MILKYEKVDRGHCPSSQDCVN
ncbi:hypothetical protein PLANTIT3_70135 [Plantibacter sp. T3]|nr:hypothetical protein PLANTIT3_70135 [Plantibacter sp. T3]